ncbi:MAG: hypothetical protein CM15mP49_02980 [Actinomycetota bacterium]|nr:MAG: hypothetical protein CM15mP49_02980 [Actinomycetota bacterium]
MEGDTCFADAIAHFFLTGDAEMKGSIKINSTHDWFKKNPQVLDKRY